MYPKTLIYVLYLLLKDLRNMQKYTVFAKICFFQHANIHVYILFLKPLKTFFLSFICNFINQLLISNNILKEV